MKLIYILLMKFTLNQIKIMLNFQILEFYLSFKN